MPQNKTASHRVAWINSFWEIISSRLLEISLAVLAVTHARAFPAIDKDPVHLITRHDLLFHFGHELEIVRPQSASHPHLRRGPMPPLVPVCIHGDPIRVRLRDII